LPLPCRRSSARSRGPDIDRPGCPPAHGLTRCPRFAMLKVSRLAPAASPVHAARGGVCEVAGNERHQPRWPAVEPVLPPETEPFPASFWQTERSAEPERPIRWLWILLGVTVLFALAVGGGYYSLSERAHTAAGLRPQDAPAAPQQSPAAATNNPPRFASGLRPITEQTAQDAPSSAAVVPLPAEPSPLAPFPEPKSARKTVRSLSAPPSPSSDSVKF
jgi:hypothetical protein